MIVIGIQCLDENTHPTHSRPSKLRRSRSVTGDVSLDKFSHKGYVKMRTTVPDFFSAKMHSYLRKKKVKSDKQDTGRRRYFHLNCRPVQLGDHIQCLTFQVAMYESLTIS